MRPRAVPLIALLALLTACGGDDKPSAATAAKPTVTPYPSIDLGDLKNGASYASRKFKPELTLTIPREGEWNTAGADNPDHVELEPEPVPPITVSGVRSANAKSTVPPVGIPPNTLSCRIQLMLLAQSPCQLRPWR